VSRILEVSEILRLFASSPVYWGKNILKTMSELKKDTIRNDVRSAYAKVALLDEEGCCASDCGCGTTPDANRSLNLGYSDLEVGSVPQGANMGLGCGNPKAIASLKEGETVLDLGSGGGFDCFLAAQEVGVTGHVIGVDMTPEMITKSRANAEKNEQNNTEFRLGEIENLPVADSTVDVIISNCVINLSPDKGRVMQEAFRVLNSGGRLAISDLVTTAQLPEEILADKAMFTGCMAGATDIAELEGYLKDAGFEQISIQPKDESSEFIRDWAPGSKIEEYIVSASIEAVKP